MGVDVECTYVCDVCCAVKVSIVVMSLFTEVLYNVSILFFSIYTTSNHIPTKYHGRKETVCVS